MTAKILILGKDGQVGSALVKLLGNRALAAGRSEADLLDVDFIAKLQTWLGDQPLSAVINAAAYTQVDKAEGEGRAAAMRVNGEAVGELAAWCKARQWPLVHYSTDYVFDGSGSAARRETEMPDPVNRYGASKLLGERLIQETGGAYFIFRTSWVYDAYGKNFFTTILRLIHEKDSLKVVADQIGAPTYAPHLARATVEVLALRERGGVSRGEGVSMQEPCMGSFPHPNPLPEGEGEVSGLYHLCNGGETSWHGFAEGIFALARRAESGQASAITCQHVNPIPSSEYPLPAPRPLNSRLDCTLAKQKLGIALPHWETALKECFEEKYAGSGLQTSGSENSPAQTAGG